MGDYRCVDLILSFGEVFELPFIFWKCVKGGMGFMNPNLDKERLVCGSGLSNEGRRPLGILKEGHLLSGAVLGSVLMEAIGIRSRRVWNHVI